MYQREKKLHSLCTEDLVGVLIIYLTVVTGKDGLTPGCSVARKVHVVPASMAGIRGTALVAGAVSARVGNGAQQSSRRCAVKQQRLLGSSLLPAAVPSRTGSAWHSFVPCLNAHVRNSRTSSMGRARPARPRARAAIPKSGKHSSSSDRGQLVFARNMRQEIAHRSIPGACSAF